MIREIARDRWLWSWVSAGIISGGIGIRGFFRVGCPPMENIETLLAAVAQTQGFEDDERVASAASELGSENSGSAAAATRVAAGVSADNAITAPATAFPAVGQVIGGGEKRKRGRPPRSLLSTYPPPPKRNKVEEEDEDVCFICFDGGSLVLCDRK